jgi:protein-arginine kinase activator protein McsA
MVEQGLESRHVSASGQKITNPKQFFSLVQQMQRYVHEQKMEEAEKVADKIVELINSR